MMISQAVIAQAATYREAFQAAQPFKHVCIDDFFVGAAAEASLRDFPPFDREFALNEYGEVGGKAVVSDIRGISPFYARLYDYLNSPEFMAAMSAVTGIEDLRGDPTLYGGGTDQGRVSPARQPAAVPEQGVGPVVGRRDRAACQSAPARC